jgi:hypothetical protein
MIILESKLVKKDAPACSEFTTDYVYVDGYYLTIHDLEKLVRNFQADCHDGFVSNDKAYIEEWLKKHNRIVLKGE